MHHEMKIDLHVFNSKIADILEQIKSHDTWQNELKDLVNNFISTVGNFLIEQINNIQPNNVLILKEIFNSRILIS